MNQAISGGSLTRGQSNWQGPPQAGNNWEQAELRAASDTFWRYI
jgi:hypothetical protein